MENCGKNTHSIAILDDEMPWCIAISKLIQKDARFCVVGIAQTQTEAARIAAQHHPDIFLVDMKLRSNLYDGKTATIAIKEISPSTDIFILSSSEEENDVVFSYTTGAERFISKDQFELLLPILVQHVSGKFSPEQVVAREIVRLRQQEHLQALTKQEQEIVFAMNDKIARSELAAVMHKSESTIKTQIAGILRKLGVVSMLDATMKIRYGGYSHTKRDSL